MASVHSVTVVYLVCISHSPALGVYSCDHSTHAHSAEADAAASRLQSMATTENKFLSIMEGKLAAGATEAHILIASPGGFVDPAFSIYNFLRGIPIPVTTHNYGNVDSIATVIYSAGKTRFAMRQCRFLIHAVTWNIGQPMALTQQMVIEILNNINTMSHNIADVLSERTGTPIEKVEADMSKGVALNAVEAKAYGLVHEFSDSLFPAGAEVVAVR
jgi:ATP-dependent Clp protease, protease subunit